VLLLTGVPLDNTFEHTIYFHTEEAQQRYFFSKVKYTFPNQTYQRVNNGTINVAAVADDIYDCNYIMFQNASYGDKWFYGFITGIDYVNDLTSEVRYQLDVMQTWFFDYQLGECFIDRETPESDDLYGNLVPENIDCGPEYVADSYSEHKLYNTGLNEMAICMIVSKLVYTGYQVTYTEEKDTTYTSVINGLATPLYMLYGYSTYDYNKNVVYISGGGYNHAMVDPDCSLFNLPAALEYYIDQGQEDAIIAMYQYPSGWGATTSNVAVGEEVVTLKKPTTLDGYTPINKKLYTYPYCYVYCTNNNGTAQTYKWENWFTNRTFAEFQPYQFGISGTIVGQPTALAYPKFYQGITQNLDSGIALNGFPQCAWVGDVYAAYLAGHANQLQQSIIDAGASSMIRGAMLGASAASQFATGTAKVGATMLGAAGGAVVGTSYGMATEIADQMAMKSDLQNVPPQVHNLANNEMLTIAMKKFGFSWYCMSIRAETAKRIDTYFSRYGYATKRVKVPNRNVRAYWTYTKTVGCVVTGSVPSADMNAICKIYDNGITFWTNGDYVGNYGLDNSVENTVWPEGSGGSGIAVDGYWGSNTTIRLQQVLGTTVDGEIWHQYYDTCYSPYHSTGWKYDSTLSGSPVIKALQAKLGVTQDGLMGASSRTALCNRYGVSSYYDAVKALQTKLNSGTV
jgi:hypothetical protein